MHSDRQAVNWDSVTTVCARARACVLCLCARNGFSSTVSESLAD